MMRQPFTWAYTERPFGSALAVLVCEVARRWAHLLKCGCVPALGARRQMFVTVEVKQAPDFPIFRQGLFINQLMGPFQAPMDHHKFFLPFPAESRGFGREFPPSDLHGAEASFELIPQME